MFKFLCAFFLAFPSVALAQLNDNFSDGNFSDNPTWLGEVTDFRVDVNQRLQLFADAQSGAKNLYTTSNVVNNAEWRFDLHFGFNPSSSNLAEVYLMAENGSLETSNALFLRIGSTADNLVLYERINGNETVIISSANKILDVDSVAVNIRVQRNGDAFSVDTASVGTSNYVTIATGNYALQNINTQFFGVRCRYTSTRSKLFYFDNFFVDGDAEQNPPQLQSISCLSSNQVALGFNEALSETSYTITDFVLNGIENPTDITFFQDSLHLTFAQDLPSPAYNALSISNIADKNGNAIDTISANFFCGDVEMPELGDVVINEIMADPNPAFVLPEVEFIEIFNRSGKAIALSSLQYFNSQTLNPFSSDTILLPNNYYTIASEASAELLRDFGVGNVLMCSSFSALSNDGDSLSLQNTNGETLDIVRYFTTIFENSNDGGVSLERINPNEFCNNPYNFNFSTATNQATPSAENSIININSAAQLILLDAELTADSTAVLKFNQAIDLMVFSGNSIMLNGSVATSFNQIFNDANTYQVTFTNWPVEGSVATLSINTLMSCAGIALSQNINLITPKSSIGGELKITELMIDPSPAINLPNAEYIEVYNSANYAVNLTDFELERQGNNTALPSFTIAPNAYTILVSNSDSALFSGFNYVGISSFPGLSNAGDSIALVHKQSQLSDVVNYTDDFYNNPDKNEGGYSLESVRINENCLGSINFMASNNADGGTPGRQNSIFMADDTTTSPQIISKKQVGSKLSLIFDRPIFFDQAFLPSDIVISPNTPLFIDGITADSLFLDLPGLQNGTVYTLSISNISDCLNNIATNITQTITPADDPVLGNLIFTEIMADPTPALALPETEYFELYNRSNLFIRFSNVCLNGKELNSNFILPPQDYVAIGSKALAIEGISNIIATESISTTFLSNAGKSLLLSNCQSGEIIAELDYSENWHSTKLAKDGGFSLELLNTTLDCYNNATYWATSLSEKGGTPGAANSQSKARNEFADAQQSLIYYKNKVLSFAFTAAMDLANLNSNLLELSDSIKLSNNQSLLSFYLKNELPEQERNYSLSLKNCNSTVFSNVNVALSAPVSPISEAVFINEIMYNPNDGLSEYIELHNASNKTIALSGTFLNIDQAEFTGRRIDTLGLILPSRSYVFLSDDTLGYATNYPSYNPLRWLPNFDLPSLSNSDVFIGLQDAFGQFVDSITYSDDLHYNLLNNTKGVALERIGTSVFSNSADAYTSAAENVNFATPGTKNSQVLSENKNFEKRLNLSDNYISANGDGFQDAVSISYTADAPEVISLLVYDRAGFVVKTIAENYLAGSNNTFIWKGDSDFNNLPEAGAYILVLNVESSGNKKRAIKRVITLSR